MKQKAGSKGFTLIELVVTISIGFILLTMAIPGYVNFTKNAKLTQELNRLNSHIFLARSEASKRGGVVAICRSANAAEATPSCGGDSKTWTGGWLVYTVKDFSTRTSPYLYSTAKGDELLAKGIVTDGVDIKTDSDADQTMQFLANGTLQTGSAEIIFCDDRGSKHAKQLSILASGRPSSEDADSCTPS